MLHRHASILQFPFFVSSSLAPFPLNLLAMLSVETVIECLSCVSPDGHVILNRMQAYWPLSQPCTGWSTVHTYLRYQLSQQLNGFWPQMRELCQVLFLSLSASGTIMNLSASRVLVLPCALKWFCKKVFLLVSSFISPCWIFKVLFPQGYFNKYVSLS